MGWTGSGGLSFDFGGRRGHRSCVPLFLEELGELPDTFPTLRETSLTPTATTSRRFP
jgi:hypothetical protein